MNEPTPHSWYSIRNEAEADAADVLIYDSIGAFGVSASLFAQSIQAIAKPVLNVRLNTPGGNVFDGIAIFNALRAHPAKVVVHVDGLAASIGSVIAMAGDEIRIARNAYMMVHNPFGAVAGDAEEMRAMAATLDKVRDTLAQTYADRSGKKSVREIKQMMDAETWLTAKEAKAAGFADTITDADGEPVRASAELAIFNKAPEAVLRMIRAKQRPAPITITNEAGGTSPGPTDEAEAAGDEPAGSDATEQGDSGMDQKTTAAPTASASEPKPATIAELKAAFPTDPAFALEAAEKAYTLTEAKASYADVLQARLTEANAKLATKAEEKPEPVAPAGNKPLGGNAVEANAGAVAYGTARGEFNAKVRALVNGGEYDHMQAVRHINREHPDLVARMREEANAPVARK